MSRVPFKFTAIRATDDATQKNIVPFATVTAKDEAGAPANIYTVQTGGTASSSFILDANGEKQIWVEPGIYSFSVAGGPFFSVFSGSYTEENYTSVEKGQLARTVRFQSPETGYILPLAENRLSRFWRFDAAGDLTFISTSGVRGLLNVEDGATANATDAALRDRATHTGVQAISTVTGLQTSLDSKELLSNKKTNLLSPDNTGYPSTLTVSTAIAAISAGESPQGAWNASTNTPTLTSSVGTSGHYYEVSVAGTTDLNGEAVWEVGDKAIFNGSVWTRVPANAVRSVNGFTGDVLLDVDTVADLDTLSLPIGSKVSTKGAEAIGDGGHGMFIVEAASGSAIPYARIVGANGNHIVLKPTNGAVNAKQFGAAGDGSTDDTDAIQRAVNYSTKIIDGLGLTYKVNNKVLLRSNLKLRNFEFDMQEFECGTSGREYALDAEGSWASPVLLTADALPDTGPNPYIELDASTIARNDLLFISHDVYWNSDNNCYIGELVEVREVVGDLVYLQNPLLYGYNVADGAYVRKITPVENVTLENCNAIGPVNPAGILSNALADVAGYYEGSYVEGRFMGFFGARYSRNIRIKNCEISMFNRAGVEFRMSMRNWVDKCNMFDIPNYYGVLVADSSRNTWITKSEFTNTRHGVSTGGSNSFGGGIVTHLYVDKCTATSRDAGLDCHDETDFVSFTNNKIFGDGLEGNADGILCQARTFTCMGNQITGNLNNAIKFQPLSTYTGIYPSCIIKDNIITKQSTKSGTTAGIQVQYGILGSLGGQGTTIDGNTISGPFTRGISLSVEAAGVSPLRSFSISGNTVRDFTASGIYVQSAGQDISGGFVIGNYVRGSGSAAYDGITLRSDTGRLLSGVQVEKNGLSNLATGIRLLGVGTWSTLYAKNNLYTGVTTELSPAFTSGTISAGGITLVGDCGKPFRVDTEAAASSDDLTTINGGFEGQILTLIAANSGRDVVVKDGTGIRTPGDFTLTHADDTVVLQKVGSNWLGLSSSDNSA